jgi:Dynamin family
VGASGLDPRSIPPQRRIHLIGGDTRTVLTSCGLDELVTRLDGEISATSSSLPSVVVAGETKRGKSSLVNALLERPDASPVGPDVVTGFFVSFLPSDQDAVTVNRSTQPTTITTALPQLADWVTVDGNPNNQKEVQDACVHIKSDALRGFALVDTPGVGGLEAGHSALTMQALNRADAMVFVIDAGAPITVPEIDFLARAAERIDTVIIVLTKIDIFPGWETVAADNKVILTKRSPRFANCPWVPVSNRLALGAIGLDSDNHEQLRSESGITTLESLIREKVVTRARQLRFMNNARFMLHALDQASAAVKERVAATAGPPEMIAALEAEKRHLADIGREGASWRKELEGSIRDVAMDRSEDLRAGLADLSNRYSQKIQGAKSAQLEQIPDELLAEIAALADELARVAAERILSKASAILGELDDSSPLVRAIGELANTGKADLGNVALPGKKSMSLGDNLTAVGSLSTGHSIETIIGGAIGGLAFLGPIGGISIGVAFWALRRWGITSQAKKGDLRAWVNQQIADANAQIATMFSRGVIALQSELSDAVNDQIAVRQKQISASLEARKRMLNEGSGEREADRAGAMQMLDRIQSLETRASRLLADLASNRRAANQVAGAR